MCRTLCFKLHCPWSLWFKPKKSRELRLEFGARCSSWNFCPHCLFLTVRAFSGLWERVQQVYASDKTVRNLLLEDDRTCAVLFVLSHFTRGLFRSRQKSTVSFGRNPGEIPQSGTVAKRGQKMNSVVLKVYGKYILFLQNLASNRSHCAKQGNCPKPKETKI